MSLIARVRSLTLLIGISLVPLLLTSCGNSVEEAEFEAARGELEQAERTLGDASGIRAETLRARIADYRKERVETDEEIRKYVALAADGDMKAAKSGLRRLGEGLRDAKARDAVERARSELSDRAAAEVVRRASASSTVARGSTVLPGESEERVRERESKLVNSMITRIVDNVDTLVENRNWIGARSMINMAIASSGEHATELSALQQRVDAAARAEMESLFEQAEQLEKQRGARASLEFLEAEAGRFPATGTLAVFHDKLAELAERSTGAPVAASTDERAGTPITVVEPTEQNEPDRGREPEPTRPRTPEIKPEPREPEPPAAGAGSDENATALLINATKLEESDRLVAAQEEWKRVSEAFPRGSQRTRAKQRAENIAARIELRRELASSLESRPDYFALLGVESIDEESVLVRGKSTPWPDLKREVFERLLLLTTLSDQARVGWIQELIVRGEKTALDELAAALARKEVSEEQAWSILAQTRDELVPEEGYAFEWGHWVDRGAAHRAELEAELAGLSKKLSGANASKRDEQFAALLARGEEARATLEGALQKRWTTAVASIQRGATLEMLARLAAQRDLLDGRRDEALALIFDEIEYFYPYNPPECPPEKARLYPDVQRRVDTLVARVQEVWNDPKRVSLPKKFTESVEELSWNRARQRELKLAFDLPADLPSWVTSIDPEATELTLMSFAKDESEREARAYDRSVLAFNESNWKNYVAEKGDEISVANNGAQEQVRVTNDYRMMMGRCALAWNPRLQASSQHHSSWMDKTGKFSHFNDEDPTRTTPGDRMRLEGYDAGISENLYQGGGGPEEAHGGWKQSSGHHRNLLMPGHREMGSAAAGAYWTQNFGVGVAFRKQL